MAIFMLGVISACSEFEANGPEPVELRDAAFVAEPFFPGVDAENSDLWEGEDAEVVATVTTSGATIRFVNEAPSAEVPSISIVVVEPDEATSVLDVVRFQGASPLELFMVLAPDESIPAELEAEHHAYHAERGLGDVPRVLDPSVRPRYLEEGVQDTWGPNCQNFQNWVSGFDYWSRSMTSRVSLKVDLIRAPYGVKYGYFGTNDYIYAGVCAPQYNALGYVTMEHYSGSNYVTTAGTNGSVWAGYRYLYANFTLNAPARRIRLANSQEYGDWEFYLSGAWKDGIGF